MLRTCCRKAEESGVSGEMPGRLSASEAECGAEPIFCDNYIEEQYQLSGDGVHGQRPALPALAGEGPPQPRGLPAARLVLEGAQAVHVRRGAALEPPPLSPVLPVLLAILALLALGEKLLVGGLLLVEAAEEADVLGEELGEVHLLAGVYAAVEGGERLLDEVGLLCVDQRLLMVGMSDLLPSFSCSSFRRRGRRCALMSRQYSALALLSMSLYYNQSDQMLSSNTRRYVGKRGLPESLLNSWYLQVIFEPIFGGRRRSASVSPLPTQNSTPWVLRTFSAPTMPVHLPVPAVQPSTTASSSWKVLTLSSELERRFSQSDSGSRSMSPSPSILLTLSSSSKRSPKPLHSRCAWHLMQGLSICESTSSMAFMRWRKGFLRPGQSKTRQRTLRHSSSMGEFFLMAEMVSENLPRPMNSSPSSWLFGQFLVKNLGKQKRLPLREYITEPVQKQRTPSSFSLMIQPAGSSASLQVSARSTLMQAEVGLPSLECVSRQWLSSSSLRALRSLLAEEVLRLRCEMASSVMSVMESTFLPLGSTLGLGRLSGFSSSKSSTKEQMNLWLADLKPSLLIHSSSSRQYLMAYSLEAKERMSKPSFLSSPTFVVFTRLPLTSSLMLSLPFSQYSPLKYLAFLTSLRTTAYSSFFSIFSSARFSASAQMYPFVSLSVIFSTTETLAAALLAQSLLISSTPDSTPAFSLPTLKLTLLASSVTCQNLPCGWIMRTGLERSQQ